MATVARSETRGEARVAAQQYLNGRLTGPNGSKVNREFTVPLIDITPSFSQSLEERKLVAAKIHNACISSGFFQITGHGVPEKTRQAIIDLAARFFKTLPQEKKEALHVKHSPYLRGYEPANYTYVNPADWDTADAAPETKEGFNWGYESGLDPTGGDGEYRELDGADINANVWPSEDDIPGFYSTIREYYGELMTLGRHLFRLFALSLDLPEDYFDAKLTHPGGIARLMYYPASKTAPQSDLLEGQQMDKEVGLGAHTDYECFTILLCSSASGLEILSPDDVWVPAPFAEGGFIVNIADFMMRWTNGVYRSTIHRVVNRTRIERYSVPLFLSINYDETIETLQSCITPENPSRYPPVQAGEYILERLRATAQDG